MLKQYGFDARWKRIHSNLGPYLPSRPFLGASALLLVGGGLLLALPDNSPDTTPMAANAENVPAPVASADESLCDKQTWPYIDQRCAARVEAARGARQVRIVTDKGTSVKTVTPLPVVEQKKPAPQPQPVVAKVPERQIGPAVIPAVDNQPAEQTVAAAPQKTEPQTTGSTPPAGAKAMASANVPPVSASTAPPSPGVEALDDARPKSRSARAAERAEKREAEKAKKREAKRRKIQDDDDAPQKVVDAAQGMPESTKRSGNKRTRAEVPDEVIEAVEAATARDRGRTVSIESPRGRRVYVVPRDGAEW